MSVKNIVDNLMEGIKFYINERIKFAPYDRTDTAIVKGISEFGYVISYNNVLYSDIKTIGGICSINETVKIMIPQNNMNNIFILKPPNGDNNYVSNDRITNSGTINTTGWVADARQLNPSISNTLAWNIAQTNSNLTRKQLIATEGTTEADIKNFISSSISNGQLSFSIVTILNSANTAFFGENGNFTILVAGDSANYGFFATNLWNGKLWTGRFATYQDDWSLVVHA